MRFGVNLPVIGDWANPRLLAEVAREAEQAGWDDVYCWDALYFDPRGGWAITDYTVALAAIASATTTVRIGTMIAQLARRRPAKLARELAALDHLSGGRLTLGVGLGFSGEAEFARFGESGDAKVRADKLDECLTIVDGLLSGESFGFAGTHYQIAEGTVFTPRPVQEHIPIWVAGYWPNKRPFQRAARWDGASPAEMAIHADGSFEILKTSPERAAEIRAYIMQHRTKTTSFDMVISRDLPPDRQEAAALVQAYDAVGVSTIYLDFLPWLINVEDARTQIRQGPPA